MPRFIKYSFLFFILLGTKTSSIAQNLDSLYQALKTEKEDTSRLNLRTMIGELGSIFRVGYWDSIAVDAKKLKMKSVESSALNNVGVIYYNLGEILKALDY